MGRFLLQPNSPADLYASPQTIPVPFRHPRRPGYNPCRGTFAKQGRMLSSTNLWMSFAGLVYLVAGVFILRKELRAARGWDKLIALGLRLHRRSTRRLRARAFPRPRVCRANGAVLHAGALVLAVFHRMRAARRRHQSYLQEVRALVVHPARTDVLSLRLHDLFAWCAPASR